MFRRFTRRSSAGATSSQATGSDGTGLADVDAGEAEEQNQDIQTLTSMGFKTDLAKRALEECDGNLPQAIGMLVDGNIPRHADTDAPKPEEEVTTGELESLDAALNEAIRLSQELEEEKRQQEELERENLEAVLRASRQEREAAQGYVVKDHDVLESLSNLGYANLGHQEERLQLEENDKTVDTTLPPRQSISRGGFEAPPIAARGPLPPLTDVQGNPARHHGGSAMKGSASSGALAVERDLLRGGGTETAQRLCARAPSGALNRKVLASHVRPTSKDMWCESELRNEATGVGSRPSSSGSGVGLQDLDRWSKGTSLMGVQSMTSTYPNSMTNFLSPQAGNGRHCFVGAPSSTPLGLARPSSRARNNGMPSMNHSSSTPLLAGATLSLS